MTCLKVRVIYFIVCCWAWSCYSMKKMINISTNSAPSGKVFSLGTIESSNVASTAIVEFLIDTSSNNYGVRGASSYFRYRVVQLFKFMMQQMWLNNCNGLAVISSLRIFSVGHCGNCCNTVIMSQLYPSEVVTSHFFALLLLHDVQLRRNWWFHLQQFQWYGNQFNTHLFWLCMEVKG